MMLRLEWTDEDGDRATFSDDPEEIGTNPGTVIGTISIRDGEDGHESAVYIDEKNAHEVIAWLAKRVAKAPLRTATPARDPEIEIDDGLGL